IIGLPFAWAHFKLAGISLWPVGKEIVSAEEARRMPWPARG
ncbi:MAG TPA: YccF domain-containing protein, partial [Xanthobacteraceae bacterium]